MPAKSRKKKAAARRRETVYPESDISLKEFVNSDRLHRRREPRIEQLAVRTDSPSVILLSSAENTPMPVGGGPRNHDPDGSSLVEVGSVPGRATRLTDVDMVLDDTDVYSRRGGTQFFASDGTNTSLVNLDETDMIIRDRPKSSVAQRWTRSGSLAPADVGEARRSSVFSMVTKRNRRKALSLVPNSSIIMEEDGHQTSVNQETDVDAVKNLSHITEEQSNSPSSGDSNAARKPFVRELVIQTRKMLKQGKTWSPVQNTAKSTPRMANSPNSSGSNATPKPLVRELVIQTRTMLKRGKKWSPVQNRAKSAPRSTKDSTDVPDKSLKKVTQRKRNAPKLQQQPVEQISIPTATNNDADQVDQNIPLPNSTLPGENPEKMIDESTADTTNVPTKVSHRKRRHNQKKSKQAQSEQNQSVSRDSDKFSKVSKRKRPKPAPDKSQEAFSEPDRSSANSGSETASLPTSGDNESSKTSSNSEKLDLHSESRGPRNRSVSGDRQLQSNVQPRGRARNRTATKTASSLKSDLDSTSKRNQTQSASRARLLESDTQKQPRTRSVSRARQPEIRPKKSRKQRNNSESNATHQPNKSSTSIRSDQPNSPAIGSQAPQSESSTSKPSTSRTRSKSVVRTKSPAAERSTARSKNRATKKPATPTRSKSVPRNALLSPPPSSANKSIADEHHIPVYRRYAEKVLQLPSRSAAKSNTAQPAAKNGSATTDADIYQFDSPSQGSSGSDDNGVGPGKTVKTATKGSTAKKRARLGSAPRNSKKTPLKKSQHHSTVFGTDMHKISSVVKKIGGGPVRRKEDDTTAGETATRNVVHTATLAAMLQSQQASNIQHPDPRSPSPAYVNDSDDDQHQDEPEPENHGFEIGNIPDVEIPAPLSPPRLNPQIQRVLKQKIGPQFHTPDKTQPNASLNFSPLGASSPWRIQNENILPKTFYFARSKDLLPSYESDLVVQDESRQAKPVSPPAPVPVLPIPTSPVHPQSPRPTNVTQHNPSKPPATVFANIQKSYEQLKATSEMSEKLITAMRKYKSNAYNQSATMDNESSPEELFAKFREYEENMKKTYLKLKQWYDRSKRTYTQSMKAIEQTAPKTQAQQELVENFRRNSQRFVTMMNDLESAMNDSNIENLSPPKTVENRSSRPAFKDIILTERNINDRNRSPLKSLDIVNLPPRFSPIKSPLVKASFTSISANKSIPNPSRSKDLFSRLNLVKQTCPEVSIAAPAESVIELADTAMEEPCPDKEQHQEQPEKDLFGFESDCEEDDDDNNASFNPTSVNITRETLKERLQSVRKLLPQPVRTAGGSSVKQQQSMPQIFDSPRRKRMQSIHSAFSSSTPVEEKRNRWAKRHRKDPVEAAKDPNVSAIEVVTAEKEHTSAPRQSPPAAVFDEPDLEFASTSMNGGANRTYSRVPRRKRNKNIYLANLGLSDSEEEAVEKESSKSDPEWGESDSDSDWPAKGKRRKKRQPKKKTSKQPEPGEKRKKQKKTVEQTAEFQNFVSEFNSMCDQVNQYQLVIEKANVVPPPV